MVYKNIAVTCTYFLFFLQIKSKFFDEDTPHSIVYPIIVDSNEENEHSNHNGNYHMNQGIRHLNSRQFRLKREILNRRNREGINTIDGDRRETFRENSKKSIIDENDSNFFIRIENAEEDIFLNLKPNHNLVSKGTVIEWVLPGGETVLKNAPDDCFLIGKSVGENENGLVALNSCDGLTGLIQTSKNSYFIEPLSSNDSESAENKQRYSFLYRRLNNTRRSQSQHAYRHNFLDGIRYQSYRNPEPHVIYNVNAIVEKLKVSVAGNAVVDDDDEDISMINSIQITFKRLKKV